MNQIRIATNDGFVFLVDLLPIFISADLFCDQCQVVSRFHRVPDAARRRTDDIKDLPGVNQVWVVTNNPSISAVDRGASTSAASLARCDSPERVTLLDR